MKLSLEDWQESSLSLLLRTQIWGWETVVTKMPFGSRCPGVCPPASADATFEQHLQRLRKLIKKRSELYEAEERALRVMLEGEQEEERKRELEKKQRKEKEKILLQKREIESKLFGDPGKFLCNQWRKGK